MKNQGLLQNPGLATRFYIFSALIIVFLIVNLTVIGGDEFFALSTSILSPLVAFLASLLFFNAAANPKDHISRPIWTGMAWGFGIWGLADLIWLAAPYMGIELPTPSFVDVVWLLGYFPLYYAFIYRVRSIRVPSNRSQRIMIMVATVLWLGLSFVFVFRHLFSDFDPQRLWEWITNISYPIGDLGLAILASHTLILLKDGRFSISWRYIVAGTTLMAFSDLLYMYAAWFGLYYPDGRVNLLTNIVDTTYILAYAAVGFGIYTYIQIWQIKEQHLIRAEITPANRFYAFVGTNSHNEIITVSDNFHYLVNANPESNFHREPIHEALGIDQQVVEDANRQLIENQVITHVPITITSYDNQQREIWVTAVAIFDPQHGFNGANVALSAELDVPKDALMPKNRELLGMLNYLISVAGSRPKDEIRMIRGYFLDTLQLFSSMLAQFGGETFKKVLFEKLTSIIAEKQIPLKISDGAIVFPEEADEENLARAVYPLINAAQQFVSNIIGEEIVREEIEEYLHRQSDLVLQKLDHYHLRDYLLSQDAGL